MSGTDKIKKALSYATDELFEDICVEYLKTILGEEYRIYGTRYRKDGGKDIVGITKDNSEKRLWAECKKHSRSIDLDTISKIILLSMKNKIDLVYIFSFSNITPNTERTISELAEEYNFEYALVYGDELFERLSILPRYKAFVENEVSHSVKIYQYISEQKYAEKYNKEGTPLKLRNSNSFYISFKIQNPTPYCIDDVMISYERNPLYRVAFEENCQYVIKPYSDKIITIFLCVENIRHLIKIPRFDISYSINGSSCFEMFDSEMVDLRTLIHFPMCSQKNEAFLNEVMDLLAESTESSIKCIDIRGVSGIGKSRLLDEIEKELLFSEWKIIRYDGKKNNGFDVFKHLLCRLIGLPFQIRNIDFTPKNIKEILEHFKDNTEYNETIYNFVYNDLIDNETLYFIRDALSHFLKYPYYPLSMILIIDNFQDYTQNAIDFLQNILSFLFETDVKLIICIAINTEDIPNNNRNKINAFMRFLDNSPEEQILHHTLKELSNKDTTKLLEYALPNINENQYLLNTLTKKCGRIPFDILMQIKYLQDKEVVTWTEKQLWYISSIQEFEDFINHMPRGSLKLIKRRMEALNQKFCQENKGTYQNALNKIIKYAIYFDNAIPISFFSYINFNEVILDYFCESLIIKYNETGDTINFYHDNYYRFFSEKMLYNKDVFVANEIISYYDSICLLNIMQNDIVLFKCYTDTEQYDRAKAFALKLIIRFHNENEYYKASDLCNKLLLNHNVDLSKAELFDVYSIEADCYKQRIDHYKGAQLYYNLFQKVVRKEVSASHRNVEQFFHKAINACINADNLNYALEILHHFEDIKTSSKFYQFIIHDRYAVTYLGLGNVKFATDNILKAKSIAEDNCNSSWISIYSSDLAYQFYRGYQLKELTKYYFKKAYSQLNGKYDSQNRKAELLQQIAFAELLDKNIKKAKTLVNESISICEGIKETYLKTKAQNLKGIICHFDGDDIENALDIWNTNLSNCQEIKNIPCQIRTYTNMGAFYFSNNDFSMSKTYFDIAFSLLDQSEFSYVHFKELILNSYRIALYYQDEKTLNHFQNDYPSPDLKQYFENLNTNGYLSECGILFFKGANYIF